MSSALDDVDQRSAITEGDVLNPVEVEKAILQTEARITRGVRVVSEQYEKFLTADREFDVAYSKAYRGADGTIEDRKHEAIIATEKLRQKRDDAEVLFKYADRQAKALQETLRAFQSVGASVRTMYGVAGRGDR